MLRAGGLVFSTSALMLRGAQDVRRRRRMPLILTVSVALLTLFTPRRAGAECGTFDLTTCVNAAQYAFWQGVAGELWSINRVLLTLAYQLDVFRAWLVD